MKVTIAVHEEWCPTDTRSQTSHIPLFCTDVNKNVQKMIHHMATSPNDKRTTCERTLNALSTVQAKSGRDSVKTPNTSSKTKRTNNYITINQQWFS